MARKQNQRKASPAAAILAVLVLAALSVWRMLGSPEDGKTQITLPNGELHVWFLDVGQADSSLLVCDGQAMLIDGGNVDDASYVVASLEQYGVTSLDYVTTRIVTKITSAASRACWRSSRRSTSGRAPRNMARRRFPTL